MQISIDTTRKREVIDITHEINEAIGSLGVERGGIILAVLHTTAALTTADLDPGTDQDMLDALSGLLPSVAYRHPHNPGHAPDHILAAMIGPSLSLVVEGGEAVIGAWQRIVLIEFDGPRKRMIAVQAV